MRLIQKELNFLKMLGYHISSSNNNEWHIKDEKNNIIGSVRYGTIINENTGEGTLPTFGYTTEIESETVSYKDSRPSNFEVFEYSFDIKGENDNINSRSHVEMSCGQSPSIKIWSSKYGNMEFRISNDNLFVNFIKDTGEEVIINFRYHKQDKKSDNCINEYNYQTSSIQGGIRSTNSIGAKYNLLSDQIELETVSWIDGRDPIKNKYNGTINDVIQMSIDDFCKFRNLLSMLLPFKKDVMDLVLANLDLSNEELHSFFPDKLNEEVDTVSIEVTPEKGLQKVKLKYMPVVGHTDPVSRTVISLSDVEPLNRSIRQAAERHINEQNAALEECSNHIVR